MDTLWKSSLNRQIKIRLFIVTIDPILLYGSETWTLSARQHRRLDECYTRILRRVLNLSWKSHPSLNEIYGDLPRISKRSVQFAGHCARASDELISSFILWRHPSSHGRSRKLTFPDIMVMAKPEVFQCKTLSTSVYPKTILPILLPSVALFRFPTNNF